MKKTLPDTVLWSKKGQMMYSIDCVMNVEYKWSKFFGLIQFEYSTMHVIFIGRIKP